MGSCSGVKILVLENTATEQYKHANKCMHVPFTATYMYMRFLVVGSLVNRVAGDDDVNSEVYHRAINS